jgi:hypothetical protein
MLHPAADMTAERTGLVADLRIVLAALAYYGRVSRGVRLLPNSAERQLYAGYHLTTGR